MNKQVIGLILDEMSAEELQKVAIKINQKPKIAESSVYLKEISDRYEKITHKKLEIH